MRALRRVATPVAVLVSGCAFPVDEFRAPSRADVGLSTNGDAARYEDDTSTDSANDSPSDAGTDACVCVKQTGPNCKEWSPVDCSK